MIISASLEHTFSLLLSFCSHSVLHDVLVSQAKAGLFSTSSRWPGRSTESAVSLAGTPAGPAWLCKVSGSPAAGALPWCLRQLTCPPLLIPGVSQGTQTVVMPVSSVAPTWSSFSCRCHGHHMNRPPPQSVSSAQLSAVGASSVSVSVCVLEPGTEQA